MNGGRNVVNVDDVAQAHVLALQRGRPGARHTIGGENLTFQQLWARLAQSSRRRAPRLQVPHSLAIGMAAVDELRSRLLGGPQLVPLEGARLARRFMYADAGEAQRELGYEPHSVDEGLRQAVAWYRASGYA